MNDIRRANIGCIFYVCSGMSLSDIMKLPQELVSLEFSLANEFTFIICNDTSNPPIDTTLLIPRELVHNRDNAIYSMIILMQMYPFILVSGTDENDMYELAILITKLLNRDFCSIIKPGTKLVDTRNRGDTYASIQENGGNPIITMRNLISSLIGCINWEGLLIVGIDKNPQLIPSSICSGRFTNQLLGLMITNIASLGTMLNPRILYNDNKSFGINSVLIM